MPYVLFEYHVKFTDKTKPDLFGVVPYIGETINDDLMKTEALGFHTGFLNDEDELEVKIVKEFDSDKEFLDALIGSPVFDYLHRVNNYAGDIYNKYYPKEYKEYVQKQNPK